MSMVGHRLLIMPRLSSAKQSSLNSSKGKCHPSCLLRFAECAQICGKVSDEYDLRQEYAPDPQVRRPPSASDNEMSDANLLSIARLASPPLVQQPQQRRLERKQTAGTIRRGEARLACGARIDHSLRGVRSFLLGKSSCLLGTGC